MSEIDWSKAPEGATHYAPLGRDYCWVKNAGNDWKVWDEREEPGSWVSATMSGSYMDSLIPRPTQWRGPDDGLPPVGVECEAYVRAETANQGAPGNKWLRGVSVGEAVAPNGGVGGLLKAEDGKVHFIGALTHFRPLKSDKDRAIDAAVAATILKDGPRIRSALSDIYDAGLLRLPEEQ